LVCLQSLSPQLKNASGSLFGRTAAQRFEILLRESTITENTETEYMYVIRFICLLIEKNSLHRIDSIVVQIEKQLDKQNGILDVTVESAEPIDCGFKNELEKMITGKTGAAGIKMDMRVIPELLAGYRLHFDGWYYDASLKEIMKTMAAELTANA